MRKVLSIALVSIFMGNSGLYAAGGDPGPNAPTQTSQKPTLKRQVVQIPPRSLVLVRLHDKEKLRGRLGEVSDEGFVVKVAQGNKIEDGRLPLTS